MGESACDKAEGATGVCVLCALTTVGPLSSQPPCNPHCEQGEPKPYLMRVRPVKRALGNLLVPSKNLGSPHGTQQEGMCRASHSQRCHHPVTPQSDSTHTEGLAPAPWGWHLPVWAQM